MQISREIKPPRKLSIYKQSIAGENKLVLLRIRQVSAFGFVRLLSLISQRANTRVIQGRAVPSDMPLLQTEMAILVIVGAVSLVTSLLVIIVVSTNRFSLGVMSPLVP